MADSTMEINYLDSYKADTSTIPNVINRLITDLKQLQYPQEEIDEIILSMDEAVTNAVQETISKQNNITTYLEERREITIRYRISDQSFDSTIIDHGKGLDIDKMLKTIPDSSSDEFHDQVFDYVQSAEQEKLHVRLNGKEITLNGIGAGLKIILSFMDSVSIDLIDTKKALADTVSEFTEGTILNMKRNRRYE